MFGWRGGAARDHLAVVIIAGLLLLLVAGLSADCGEFDDPYSGEWKTGDDRRVELSISRSDRGDGWWRVTTAASTFDAHEEDGRLVSAGGRTTLERRGEKLALTVVPGSPPVMLSRE